jgi:hypothetical protein
VYVIQQDIIPAAIFFLFFTFPPEKIKEKENKMGECVYIKRRRSVSIFGGVKGRRIACLDVARCRRLVLVCGSIFLSFHSYSSRRRKGRRRKNISQWIDALPLLI